MLKKTGTIKAMLALVPGVPGSPNRRILRATLIVGLVTLLAKLGGTLKELVVANSFGRSDALDAFFIAFLLPSFLVGVVVGAFAAAMIPVFVATREQQGREAAQRLFSSVIVLVLIALAAITVLLGLLSRFYLPLLGSGFSQAKLRLTLNLLYSILPFVFFSGLSACASAMLNAGKKFALPAVIPVVTSLATIGFLIFAARRWGPFALAGGLVTGSFMEAALLLHALKIQGVRLLPRWNGLDSGLRSVLGQFLPALGAGFLSGSTSLVDQSMAAMLPQGSVSALNYGNRVTGAVLTISAFALGTAAFPYLSKMAAQRDWKAVRHTLKRYCTLVITISLPFTVALMVCSTPLIRLLFQRGSFTAADTHLVSWVQICYAAQIPFCITGMLFVRFLASVRRNRALLYASAAGFILDITLNLVLMRIWGVAGIALATSLLWVAWAVGLGFFSVKLLKQQHVDAGAPAFPRPVPQERT